MCRSIAKLVLISIVTYSHSVSAEVICDDFTADPDPWDCTPICWQPAPCCPGPFEIDEAGLGMGGGNRQAILVHEAPLTGDLRVRASVDLTHHNAVIYVNTDEADHGYWGGISREGLLVLGKDPGDPKFRLTTPASFPLSGNVEIEFTVGGDLLEVRVWPSDQDRPNAAQLTRQDLQYRAGYAGIGVRDGRLLSVCIETSETLESARFQRGDCNGDGETNLTDAVRNLRYCFTGENVPCAEACDIDGDGGPCNGVNDGIYLLNALFRGGAAPPAPFPECGSVDGEIDCETPPASC